MNVETKLPSGVKEVADPTGIDWRHIALQTAHSKKRLIDLFPNQLERAKEIVRKEFQSDIRRDDTSALGHMERVAKSAARFNDPELEQIAWLHDLVEEKKYTIQDLKDLGFSPRVVTAVDALSKREMDGEGYLNYIERLAHNIDAIIVKLIDIDDNSTKGAGRDRMEFLYPVAKAYLIDAQRRHNRDQPLIPIGQFMYESKRIKPLYEANPDGFNVLTRQHSNNTIIAPHFG